MYLVNYKRLIAFSLFCFLNTLISFGCKYTVREIGFSDFGSSPYYLYIFANSETSEKDISSISKLSRAFLNETNIKIKLVDIDKDKSSLVVDYLNKYNIKSFPSAVFAFPEGGSLFFSLNYPGRSLNESVWLLLENLVTSPFRKSIKDELLKAYCVVLVIEGSNELINKKVLDEVKETVSKITMTLDQMPKIVNSPPSILIIPGKKVYDEKILLMSLGITEKEFEMPSVSIIYGRGRIMGPVLLGEQITSNKIINLLTIVGADCECGLDNSWVLGRMIPLQWDMSIQSVLAEYLGFDVENPLVKSEMSQILSVKPTLDNPFDPLANNLLGYSEGKIMIVKSTENISKISAVEIRKSFYRTKPSINNLVFRTILMGFGGILIIVFVIAVFLVIKFKRKDIER